MTTLVIASQVTRMWYSTLASKRHEVGWQKSRGVARAAATGNLFWLGPEMRASFFRGNISFNDASHATCPWSSLVHKQQLQVK